MTIADGSIRNKAPHTDLPPATAAAALLFTVTRRSGEVTVLDREQRQELLKLTFYIN